MKLIKIIKYIIFLSIISISGCALSPPNLVEGVGIPSGSGVLVLALHTNWKGHTNPLLNDLELLFHGEGDHNLNYKIIKFQGEEHIAVIALPAREYYFYRLTFGNRYLHFKNSNKVRISPNKITYIGDITSNILVNESSIEYDLKIDERFESIQAYLKEDYPKTLSSYSLEKNILPFSIWHE